MISYLLLLEDPSDGAVFTEVYEQYVNQMLSVARRYFPEQKGSSSIAEDVVHDAFVALAENFKKFLTIPCPKRGAYLVTIVKHKCVDEYRRASKRVEVDIECAEELAPVVDGLGEDYELAVKLIRELPEKYRLVMESRLLLGMSHREIGVHLGITEDLASKRYNRGREMLKEGLRKEGITRG